MFGFYNYIYFINFNLIKFYSKYLDTWITVCINLSQNLLHVHIFIHVCVCVCVCACLCVFSKKGKSEQFRSAK